MIATLAFLALAMQTVFLGNLEWHDAHVQSFLRAVRVRSTFDWMSLLTKVSPYAAATFVLGALVFCRSRGARVRDAVGVLALLAVGLLLVEGLKLIFERARPGAPWNTIGDSFPSGHVAYAALCTGAALRLLCDRGRLGRLERVAVFSLGLLFVPAVAFSRLYLDRHWLTDVTASMLLAFSYWSAMSLRALHVPHRLWPVLAVALVGLYGTAACGGRIYLPSPVARAGPARLAPTAASSVRERLDVPERGVCVPEWRHGRSPRRCPAFG
jgi:membrane-associated phospholipid phosphatase